MSEPLPPEAEHHVPPFLKPEQVEVAPERMVAIRAMLDGTLPVDVADGIEWLLDHATKLKQIADDVVRDWHAEKKRGDKLESILTEIVTSGVEFDDERIKYVTMQIDRVDLQDANEILGIDP